LHLTGRIWREGDDYVSWCPELDIASYGTSYDHALSMLRDAVIGYVEEIGYEAAATEAHPDAATFSLEVPIHGDAA
jgi:predicted RNase H-like HicB family nuclease